MNLTKLFETQKALDDRIIEKHGLQDMDRLPYLIIALQVELGECANEHRGFKYWSEDQEPRNKVFTMNPGENDQEAPLGGYKNPLLEEYVDCLHFILSIGLELNITEKQPLKPKFPNNDVTKQFIYVMDKVTGLYKNIKLSFGNNKDQIWQRIFSEFVRLGESMGFSWNEVEQAYFAKNKVNHERQANGY
ncbi:dUTP diphosphatase [Salicibibacter cibarius]|uniref:dUTP diphosphatase n=1 Tax=Salicibibacter cibarius TaxID=2743000 RepID=A0A7T6Z184_9BACI|nr:dUTP diphosphatase [Salicibibacter cibarius]QQK75069.1 dUTP diphosphatase [Salicibibacter cibarius]